VDKRTYKAIVLLIVVLSLVTSACFQIRNFRITPDSVAAGERSLVRVDQAQLSDAQGNSDGRPFLLIGFTEADMKLKAVSEFDTFGNYGGPFARQNDNTLRNLLRTSGNCSFNGIDAADITGLKWWAYRTTATMDSNIGAMADLFRVKLSFERVGGDDDDHGVFVIFSGTWAEVIVDGIPVAGEVLCFSMVGSSIAHKP